jgi:hypothetical protein
VPRLLRIVLAFGVATAAAFPQSIETARRFGRPGELALDTTQQPSPELPPREWIEPATGHRVVRLTETPGSASLYFHQNQYTAAGDKMVFTTR